MALKVKGNVLSCECETIEYKSKKTGNQEKLVRATIVLQGEFGIMVVNAFNPAGDIAGFKAGSSHVFELSEYKVDSGLQKGTVRL